MVIKVITGILLIGIGVGSFYLYASQIPNQPYKVALHYRGGSLPNEVSAPVIDKSSLWRDFLENVTPDKALNWLANVVTIVTGVLLILRRRRED